MKLALALLALLSLVSFASPALADADAKSLAGTWTKADNPKITWTFGADGAYTTHNPTLGDIKGKFTVAGGKLTTKLTDLPERVYTIVEASAHKLVLKDESHTITFTK